MTSSQPPHRLGAPPVLERAGEVLQRYDVIFCDVWGVIHNGLTAFKDACAALKRFRDQGGTVILVSNAPVPKARVVFMLERCHVPPDTYDDIVSSGDIALAHVADRKYQRLFCIGPQERDAALFKSLTARSAPLDDAQGIICTGLNDDRSETPDDYMAVLRKAHELKLPFICANPDFVVDVGGTLLYCAGAIADLYQHIGGEVVWTGKPHLIAYKTAQRKADELRNTITERKKCLVIGDAIRTDLKGAENFGCDALFVASGIHRHDTMDGDKLSNQKLEALFSPSGTPQALCAMAELKW